MQNDAIRFTCHDRHLVSPDNADHHVALSENTHELLNMRAYQLPKGGAGIDALVKVELPNPRPSYRQILVKVAACSLNYRDLAIARGTYRMPVRERVIPLSDGAGEVIEVGEGVRRVKIGDLVAGNFFQRWSAGEPGPDRHHLTAPGRS